MPPETVADALASRVPARRGPEAGLSAALFVDRHVPMPASASFPSGHAASAFAFAHAVGRHLPVLAVPIRLLVAAVADRAARARQAGHA